MAAFDVWPNTTWVGQSFNGFATNTAAYFIPIVRRAAESLSTLAQALRRPLNRPPVSPSVLEPLRPVQRVFCVAPVYRTAREYRLRPGMRRLARA